jgi:release factor glutamine methyltransferase
MALLFSLPPARVRARFERLHRSVWRVKYVPYYPSHARLCGASFGTAEVELNVNVFPKPLKEKNPSLASSTVLVHEWRVWAREFATATRVALPETSDLPELQSLFTEIDWLVEDTVGGGDGGADVKVSWSASEKKDEPSEKPVLLRESLEGLRALWATRLTDRVPLQYLTNLSEWRDLSLVVTRAVLIPRPETELMVDFVVDVLRETPELANKPWADLGTGSGALAIGIAKELERTVQGMGSRTSSSIETTTAAKETPSRPRVYAVDFSPAAAAVAKHNATRNGVNVEVHEGSWFEPLRAVFEGEDAAQVSASSSSNKYSGTLGGVVSNPPYIPRRDMAGLQPEVGKHEPHLALCGGDGQGMDAFLPIYKGAARYLVNGGFLLLETNGGAQAVEVARRIREFEEKSDESSSISDPATSSRDPENKSPRRVFVDVQIRKDLRGLGRFVSARKGTC